jgi:DNA-binding MarR family transcriptional regulator
MEAGILKALTPTLWRTCRTLANRRRLRLFQAILSNPDVSVAEIAARLRMNPALASKYLRELNARGLLAVRRHAGNVFYRIEPDSSVPQARSLIDALTGVFHEKKSPVDVIFRKVTAFTHPRRIAIVRRLSHGPTRFSDLRRELKISSPALQRHLHKLASRGFLQSGTDRGIYALKTSCSPLELALLRLAQYG